MAPSLKSPSKALNIFAILTALVCGGLIYAGGFVTSIGAGLAVPDWPLSFGSINPPGWWEDRAIRAEHGHRLIGATVGFFTLILFFWILKKEKTKWIRIAGGIAILTVILQGVLGGLRVIEKNISYAMVHACLAQAFFCLLIVLAWATSRSWVEKAGTLKTTKQKELFFLSLAMAGVVFFQLIVGAVMRHSMAGLAIPTFPWVFGGILPPFWNFNVTIHYIHRVLALAVFGVSLFYFFRTRGLKNGVVKNLSNLILALVCFQGLLGASIIWSTRAAVPTTAHVLGGALILAASVSSVFWLLPETAVKMTDFPSKG